MKGFPKETKCKDCKCVFVAKNPRHIYCGDRDNKTGCAYIRHKDTNKGKSKRLVALGYYKTEKARKYQQEWHAKRRSTDTVYREEQNKASAVSKKKKPILYKEIGSDWRKRNKDLILLKNRERILRLKGVEGSHSIRQWESLKKKHGFKCAVCSISEDELKSKWESTHTGFCLLTKDHIVPISKGGNNSIGNIRPLCISCNAKKRDSKINIAITCGVFDIFHKGHYNLLYEMNKIADYVIVILHDDHSVFENKGHVSIQSYEHRAENLILTGLVNEVFITENKNPKEEIMLVCKKYSKHGIVYIRGDDWLQFPGRDKVEELGIEIKVVPYTEGVSTTQIRKEKAAL
ncbi:TPA: hypothetical protein DEB29_03600 [Candidatus Wolfebacteria bacterium]|nr:hypothetical protein [Candidatus Wolfebacteria bacterium]